MEGAKRQLVRMKHRGSTLGKRHTSESPYASSCRQFLQRCRTRRQLDIPTNSRRRWGLTIGSSTTTANSRYSRELASVSLHAASFDIARTLERNDAAASKPCMTRKRGRLRKHTMYGRERAAGFSKPPGNGGLEMEMSFRETRGPNDGLRD